MIVAPLSDIMNRNIAILKKNCGLFIPHYRLYTLRANNSILENMFTCPKLHLTKQWHRTIPRMNASDNSCHTFLFNTLAFDFFCKQSACFCFNILSTNMQKKKRSLKDTCFEVYSEPNHNCLVALLYLTLNQLFIGACKSSLHPRRELHMQR